MIQGEKNTNKDWLRFAACRNMGPELFMSQEKKDIEQARAVCFGCPAVKACLEYALENREQGVWGGTTDRQRRRIKRERKLGIKRVS